MSGIHLLTHCNTCKPVTTMTHNDRGAGILLINERESKSSLLWEMKEWNQKNFNFMKVEKPLTKVGTEKCLRTDFGKVSFISSHLSKGKFQKFQIYKREKRNWKI
ncbi:hypothetical protein Avbf_09553 [Armadillidium vulgare]|nr:hypothetical protein Avbf_09553 [Armadillidium vulgare]